MIFRTTIVFFVFIIGTLLLGGCEAFNKLDSALTQATGFNARKAERYHVYRTERRGYDYDLAFRMRSDTPTRNEFRKAKFDELGTRYQPE